MFDPCLVVEVPDHRIGDDVGAGIPCASAPETFEVAGWTILRIGADAACYVLGYRVATGRGRASSPICAFDPATATATTSSGNRYVLVGDPSGDGLDDPLVRAWLAPHRLRRCDVEVVGTDGL